MILDIFSNGCDFQFGGAQVTHDIRWPGGRGMLCVPSGVVFSGAADITIICLADGVETLSVNDIGEPPGFGGPVTATGNYVFDAPPGTLRFSVTLSGGGDRLQVSGNIFVSTL
jgi:hypothetical protein